MSDTRKRVRVYVRIGDATEACIGTARTMSEIPALLEEVAARLRAGLAPDALETRPPRG